ncbi:MAG TPA: DUF1926 domain-containing protein [Candidatus Hydrogenedentes bacterium]|nr:DUF1926 domain-containing protein [Candidatus Hydrogenedentota bacterium]HPG69819.1 DUF1926 domain-containing protein [Candidatus Hydrogenedentota bacterium]
MSKQISLIFGCHSHQPVGNFESVFASAYEKAYKPFLDVLERYPNVHVTQHFTGPLLDWFAAKRPEFLERLASLASRGQVEIMGGGYYEPLLCAIPERDAVAQIQRMASFCEQHFGVVPRGMWLPERVWEPHMPRTLSRAGIEYTALDDTHFLCSGLEPAQLFGYYVTESEGYTVKVFPILKQLRYLIPFHQVFKTLDFLREHVSEDEMRCAVIHDDGEKFGVWPGTHKSVYGEGWLEAFFEAVTENRDWLKSVTYSEYLDEAQASGRAYLTAASYEEMMEWALPTPMQLRLQAIRKRVGGDPQRAGEKEFIRGGFWRGFLSKYEESNNLHKRMLSVSNRLEHFRRGDNGSIRQAEQLLHEGQCNCAYWHGVFGGLYLNHLRTAVYEKLIGADRVLDTVTHPDSDWVDVQMLDFDADGADEVTLSNSEMWLGVKPNDGGSLFEWDYKPKPFNFCNTLTRRREPYHDSLRTGTVGMADEADGEHSIHEVIRVKERGLEHYLVYDPYRRVSLREHFFEGTVSADALWRGEDLDRGDFSVGVYAAHAENNGVTLERRGRVVMGGAVFPLRLTKRISLDPRASRFEIRYDLENLAAGEFSAVFGVELVINLLTGTAFDRYYRSDDRDLGRPKLGAKGDDEGLSHIALRDDWQRLECGFRFGVPAEVHRFAIETVSQSEAGQERVYQGSVLVPCWRVDLMPQRPVSVVLSAEASWMD